MEKSTLQQPFDLENLVREKEFHALSQEERTFVLEEMTEAEYFQMRKLVLWSGSLLRDTSPSLSPDPSIRLRLNEHMQEKNSKARVLRLLRYPVPAWQVAAVMLMMVMGAQVFRSVNWLQHHPEEPNIQFVDSTTNDSALKVGHHPGEDSVFATFEDSL